MHVLYDVFELTPKGGKSIGIYQYARHLLRAMAGLLPADMHLVVPCHGDNAADFEALSRLAPGKIRCVLKAPATPGKLHRQWWSRVGARKMMREHACGVYFTPKGFLPGSAGRLKGIQTCAVVHDLIPLWYAEHHPGQFSWLETQIVNRGLMRSCRHADTLITISQAAAHDITRRLPDAKRPTVIYNGLAPAPLLPLPAEPVLPYLFAMTSALPHKNAAVLLDAYRAYRQMVSAPLPLVVCGLDACDLPGVTAVKGITPEQLHTHYRDCQLCVFLSLTEGFGFPPLEAMQHGTPTLCADIDVLRETTRGNAVFVDPRDPAAIARELEKCLGPAGAPLLDGIRARCPEVVTSFQWERCAADVLRAMQQAAAA